MKSIFIPFFVLIVLGVGPAQAARVCVREETSVAASNLTFDQFHSLHANLFQDQMAQNFFVSPNAPKCSDVKAAAKALNVATLMFSGASAATALCGPQGAVVSAVFAGGSAVVGYLALEVADLPCEDTDTEAMVEKKAKRIVCEVLEAKNMPCDPSILN